MVSETRDNNKLILNINNTTSSTSASLLLNISQNENSTTTTADTVPVTLLPNATTQVVVDLKDSYQDDANLFMDSTQQDLAYMNDGNWNYSLGNSNIVPNSFVINNDGIMPDAGELRLFRDVNISVNVSDYVSIYKMMAAGGLSKDITAYKALMFNASASGAGQLKIVLQKASISNWNSQYSYTLNVTPNPADYVVNLSDFTSSASNDTLTANDIVTVTFSFISNGGNNITASIANVKFGSTKIATPAVVDSVTANTSLQAYPNPVREKFTCTFKSDVNATMTLKVIELATGRTVMTQAVNATIGNNSVVIPANRNIVRAGQYVLVLQFDGNYYTPLKLTFAQY